MCEKHANYSFYPRNARQIAFLLIVGVLENRKNFSLKYRYSTVFAVLSCNLYPAGVMAGVCWAQFSLAAMAAAKVCHNYVCWSWLEGSQVMTYLLLCGSVAWLKLRYQGTKLGELPVKEPFPPASCRQGTVLCPHWQGKAGQHNCKSGGLEKSADSHSLILKTHHHPFPKTDPLVVKQESPLQNAHQSSSWVTEPRI